MTIKEWIENLGITLKEASEQTGVPYKTMQNWVAGTRKPPAYVERFLDKAFEQKVIPTLQGKEEPEYNIGVAFGLIYASTGNIPDWQLIQREPLKRYGIVFGKLITKIPKPVQTQIVPFMADIPWAFEEKSWNEINAPMIILGYYAGVKWCMDNGYYKENGNPMVLG